MELEQKRALLSIREQNKHNQTMEDCRLLSLRKLRKNIGQNSKKIEGIAGSHLEDFKNTHREMLKKYAPQDEVELSRRVDFNFTKNDSSYMTFVKQGHVFGQHFRKDTNNIYIIREPDLSTFTTFSMSDGKSLSSGKSCDFYTYPTYKLSKVFFSNGKIEKNVSSDWCGFFSQSCKIGRKAPIDSLLVNFSLNSIFECDTLVLTVDDVGKTYNDITLHELKNNSISLESNNDKIIKIVCRNDRGMYLEDEYRFTDSTPCRSEKAYDKFIEENRLLKKKLDAIDNKEDALRLLEDSFLDSELDPSANLCENYLFYKGNIKEVVIYRILKRDNIVFDAMFRAANPNQQLFTNGFNDKTEILNRKGEVVHKLPIGQLNFATSRSYNSIDRGFENVHYLKNSEENYHFDIEKKSITKMNTYSLKGALSSNLVKVWDNKNYNLCILDKNMIAINDSTYDKIELNGELIIAKKLQCRLYNTSIFKCHIYDGNGQKVLPYYVTSVAPHYKGIYRVTVNNKIGYMASTGEWLIKPKYDMLDIGFDRRDEDMKYFLQMVSLNGKMGLIDLDNHLKQLIPCKYEELIVIPETNGQFYIASSSYNYCGVIDINGKIISPFKTISYNNLYNEFIKTIQKP
ncbi:hypothetical protein K5X82_17900 [Halosquirtibacter xylanolyticus]|uniref:hypothetical protein n=1 Tax=Halosquirtibacter xylanolyticus TaxID=3374599 RepID=UPI003748CA42|nr:hypothetical protein K5X82_17900 [Prolixibacteraceae bacterium]